MGARRTLLPLFRREDAKGPKAERNGTEPMSKPTRNREEYVATVARPWERREFHSDQQKMNENHG